jgi:hypothetical protein
MYRDGSVSEEKLLLHNETVLITNYLHKSTEQTNNLKIIFAIQDIYIHI